MTDDSFAIRLPQFEGPFDLLLFFIERDELNIHDIPIAKIADDFLNYLHQMSSLNMEIASEFIFVAATLMRIKAKMLLPRYGTEEAGDDPDTKENLIRKLIEYKKFKEVCEEIRPMEDERFKQEKRGNIKHDLEQVEKVAVPGEELSELTLYRLMVVYERMIRNFTRRSEEVKHTVVQYPYTIEKQKKAVADLLKINKMLDFKAIAKESENKVHFVYNFLAVLEMLQQELIDIQIGLGYNNFWISPKVES
ncbi:chromosome segregation protein ScpA [Mucilaginibacter rubeus]|uniref:Segregation and condensation protein A n=1 Tax=Mucilaginibacter rubeus TaxID=2027860 RepID=A0AAE6MJQ0_9SPHI|nr:MULTISPECIES: segregation/condensation protein A [Mucilaginibacter]QEM05898.1 chromosome segregation protein ScpA [Mucilaginibacter rubeus]QEM18479.1 chromosome segregation protein ScpA [Mucilaginibacter gossypii]QTE44982.1 segregation/condensation protein A [Mucilaginibacter rubeus]QTE51579.1 segregation/condensation protein A [Mucilaginibacter rubeus]QTE56666.1 segregation/condensation protein A [Mucilaginibacter rubeus]